MKTSEPNLALRTARHVPADRSASLTLFAALTIVTAALVGPASAAAIFASSYTSYTPGSVSASYQDPTSALGKPNPVSGLYALTPFNAAFQPSDLTGIGPGGSLTLKLSDPVSVGPGRELGIHAGVNLADASVPNGQNRNPASTFNFRAADVAVSADGNSWVDLGSFTFDLPTNFYDQGVTIPGAQTSVGPNAHEADFGKPFDGTLHDFDGKDWTGTLGVLDGSAGGKWLDVTPDQIAQFQYVRFSVGTGQVMFVDAVAAVPEPISGGLVGAVAAALLLGRRRRRGKPARVGQPGALLFPLPVLRERVRVRVIWRTRCPGVASTW